MSKTTNIADPAGKAFNNKAIKQPETMLSFQRRLRSDELPDYNATITTALKRLDKDNFGIIAQAPSLPSIPAENTGIGSPYTAGSAAFFNFLSQMGFNCIQLGPAGKTKRNEASPYTSTIFSENPLFIDLKSLTTPEWGGLLPENNFNKIVDNNDYMASLYRLNTFKDPIKREEIFKTPRVNYEYIYDEQQKALKEVWNNYKTNLAGISSLDNKQAKTIATMKSDFDIYKEKSKFWLDNDALYEALSIKHSNDYWPKWPDEIDKGLIKFLKSDNKKQKRLATERLDQIKSDPKLSDEMEFYKFCQFILDKQKSKASQGSKIKTIADIQVTYSDRDWWANQDLFLNDYFMGVPPDYFSQNGQAWGFPVLDPEKIFLKDKQGKNIHQDGKPVLGEGGKLIKQRFDKVFRENPGGVRIDHIVGLIDPWVYPVTSKTAKSEDGGARLYSSPEKGGIFSLCSRISVRDLNTKVNTDSNERVKKSAMTPKKIDRYSEIIDIIIQSAKDNNVPLQNIICEDLGTITNPVQIVLKSKGMSGLRVTEFVNPTSVNDSFRASNVEPKHWIVPGTHDNDSILGWAKSIIKDGYAGVHSRRLGLDLRKKPVDPITKDLKYALEKSKIIRDNPVELARAKFAELFTSPARNVQIMFTDLFGIQERYNTPGVTEPEDLAQCWRLRIPDNYEDFYYKQLIIGKGLNLPEALGSAMKTNANKFSNKPDENLINKLDHYAKVLKDPEP